MLNDNGELIFLYLVIKYFLAPNKQGLKITSTAPQQTILFNKAICWP